MGEGRRAARGGGARALLAAAAVFATALSAQQSETLPDASHLQWSGALEQRTLGDGSVLSAYTARTVATDAADVAFKIGFVPRFGCSSTIGIRFGNTMASVIEAFFEDGDSLTLDIDGETFEWPLTVDADGVTTTLWLHDGLERRERVRRLVDAGSRMSLALPNSLSVAFSLLGSRRSVEAVEKACRAHEPIPWNG